ncbi:MAG: hypothetical protein QG635_843, partial [Bacteroidota bacterium]|nr:hypothetical protein [Bacteroidota bacterium]
MNNDKISAPSRINIQINMKLFYISIVIISLAITSISAGANPLKDDKAILLLPANITFGGDVKNLSEYKVDAALNMICLITKKYQLIPFSARDSIAESLKTIGLEPTVAAIADSAGAGQILFIRISQLKNILRADITLNKTDKSESISRGIGYAFLNFRDEASDKALYDPALLKALQRAFAAAEGDSAMFGSMNVIPAKSLVVGGMIFEDDGSFGRTWELFQNKGANSFDAVETIFSAASKS